MKRIRTKKVMLLESGNSYVQFIDDHGKKMEVLATAVEKIEIKDFDGELNVCFIDIGDGPSSLGEI